MGRNKALHDDDLFYLMWALTELAVVYEDGNLISVYSILDFWVSETIIMSYTVALLLLFRLWTVRPHHVEATHRPLQLISAHFEFAWPWACVSGACRACVARITLCIISRRALIHSITLVLTHAHGSRKLLIRSELKSTVQDHRKLCVHWAWARQNKRRHFQVSLHFLQFTFRARRRRVGLPDVAVTTTPLPCR